MWTRKQTPPPRPLPAQFACVFLQKTPAANCARERFLLWEMGFPGAKISIRAAARGDFPNCQKRSALADLFW
ncbi:MAG: hypothetical protein DBY29_04085 [Coprobacillus sp.]|nr:MAG: hypothetical protein DBY29_04085 [Coprobacillus sp.]